jgi:UDP-2,3-diacylglucosamine hydrolase
MWMSGYFEQELGIPVYYAPKTFEFNGKKVLVGHGDGLGPGDYGYKFLKKIFRNPLCKFLFGLIPPFLGIGLAGIMSKSSRSVTGDSDATFLGADKEWLIIYCTEQLKSEHHDYFIFGHRHLPILFQLNEKSTYINLGDWIRYFTYAEFHGDTISLKTYSGEA